MTKSKAEKALRENLKALDEVLTEARLKLENRKARLVELKGAKDDLEDRATQARKAEASMLAEGETEGANGARDVYREATEEAERTVRAIASLLTMIEEGEADIEEILSDIGKAQYRETREKERQAALRLEKVILEQFRKGFLSVHCGDVMRGALKTHRRLAVEHLVVRLDEILPGVDEGGG